jgi:Periplasmic binding protein-like domain
MDARLVVKYRQGFDVHLIREVVGKQVGQGCIARANAKDPFRGFRSSRACSRGQIGKLFGVDDHLAGLGHRKVGFIGGPSDEAFALRRKAAFLEAAAGAGLETRVFDSDFTVQGGYFGCSRVLGGFNATAIMAANDLMAIGALHYAYDRQIAVPSELSVIGFDNIDVAQFTQPALTTVAVPQAEIGHLVFQSLWSLINESPAADYEVKTNLVIRQTTAVPPHAVSGSQLKKESSHA